MKILQISSSVRGENSYSTQLAYLLVERLIAARRSVDETEVAVRDLGRSPHPLLDGATLQALFTVTELRTPEQAARVALDDALIEEIQSADIVVLGVPMYNFGVPAQLTRILHKLTRALTCLLIDMKDFVQSGV